MVCKPPKSTQTRDGLQTKIKSEKEARRGFKYGSKRARIESRPLI